MTLEWSRLYRWNAKLVFPDESVTTYEFTCPSTDSAMDVAKKYAEAIGATVLSIRYEGYAAPPA